MSPTSATCLLTRSGDGFKGEALFRATLNRSTPTTREQRHPVIVPISVMESVLGELAIVKVGPGPYKPWISWTDDYSDNALRVTVGSVEVRFYSQSQGATGVPWGVEVNGQVVVAESPDIIAAFARLDPCLLLDTYQQMIQDADKEFRDGPR